MKILYALKRTNRLKYLLNHSKVFFIFWCMLAAFGTYFCMYAFRKPFTSGTYSGMSLWDLDYKAVLIIAQVLGYMLSKFMGIKVISELKASGRKKLIIGLILFAELSLLFFGLVPYPYNFFFLFLNGLPLGMVWGIIFSYLEGRRFTEMLAMGMSISLIVSSGIIKTVYFMVHDWLPFIDEFWMPCVIGLLFLPLFLMFVWMLSVIPEPTEADKLLRVERLPMTAADKRLALKEYGLAIFSIGLIYTMLTTMRDFRDNFSVEIWNEIAPHWDKSVFSLTEAITGIIVLIAIGSLSLIRNNIKGFWMIQYLIASGLVISGGSTLLFYFQVISPFWWMLLVGMGLFLAYTPIQVVLFERMIALFKIRANAGFFVYMCDSAGYLGSVGLLLYKEFFMKDISWAKVLMQFSYVLTVTGLILLLLSSLFFNRKMGNKRPFTAILKRKP
jgi:MFS family permease